MQLDVDPRPRTGFVAAATKSHLNLAQTRDWLTAIVDRKQWFAGAKLLVLPSFPALSMARRMLAGTGIGWGAQNVHSATGPFTGEVTAPMLAQLDCAAVQVGHSERRRLFGETDSSTAAKAIAVAAAGMVPIVCVGEARFVGPHTAIRTITQQLRRVLADLPETCELIIAYEPQWAMGRFSVSATEHIAAVLCGVAVATRGRAGPTRLAYAGGSRPGVYTELRDAGAPLDGILTGRAALDPQVLADIAAEVSSDEAVPDPALPVPPMPACVG